MRTRVDCASECAPPKFKFGVITLHHSAGFEFFCTDTALCVWIVALRVKIFHDCYFSVSGSQIITFCNDKVINLSMFVTEVYLCI